MNSLESAQTWLAQILRQHDIADGKRIKELARDAGISERTLYRAARAVGVRMLSGGFGKARLWHLCRRSTTACHVCQTSELDAHDKVGADEKRADSQAASKATSRLQTQLTPELERVLAAYRAPGREYDWFLVDRLARLLELNPRNFETWGDMKAEIRTRVAKLGLGEG